MLRDPGLERGEIDIGELGPLDESFRLSAVNRKQGGVAHVPVEEREKTSVTHCSNSTSKRNRDLHFSPPDHPNIGSNCSGTRLLPSTSVTAVCTAFTLTASIASKTASASWQPTFDSHKSSAHYGVTHCHPPPPLESIMGPWVDLLVSLGKTAAQITADFSPVPGLCVAVELLCAIMQLCENVPQNR